jgi:KDO2-lipid IV(A) lauroyltransferase
VARLETGRALAWAGALGRAWARAGGPRVADARVNLRIAFPERSEAWRRRVLEDSLAHLARSFVEFAQLARLDREALRGRVAIDGLEHLHEARKRSRTGGVAVLTGHFGSWELFQAAMAAEGFPVAVVARRRDSPVVDTLVTRLRSRGGSELLLRGNAALAARRALREGRLLAMPLDQNAPRQEGLFVPFFGRLACTRDGPVRLIMRSGAAVLPVFVFREGEGPRHVARVQPPLELVPTGDDREAAVRENTARMTRVIEAAIRQAPDHWTWIHRRWRTAPPGEPHPYGRQRG